MMDSSSIAIERLFSHAKRTMTSDRNSMGNTFFEAILVSKFNPDLLAKSKQYMLDHIYDMVINNE